jgi:hypothetical protein
MTSEESTQMEVNNKFGTLLNNRSTVSVRALSHLSNNAINGSMSNSSQPVSLKYRIVEEES